MWGSTCMSKCCISFRLLNQYSSVSALVTEASAELNSHSRPKYQNVRMISARNLSDLEECNRGDEAS